MKTLKYIFSSLLVFTLVWSCTEDEMDTTELLNNIEAPSNVSAAVSVTQDNSGLVTTTPLANGATSFVIDFGDASEISDEIIPGKSVDHIYEEGTYEMIINATTLNGKTTAASQNLVVSFLSPQNLVVTIENDIAISKQVNVKATADYALSYEVDFGEAGSVPLTGNIGEMVSFLYQNTGLYTITITAFSAAIETTTYSEEFEVTAIEQPLASAPLPPPRDENDVISIFSGTYNDIPDTNYFPDWGQGGQGSGWAMFDLGGDEMLQYINLSYQGIVLAENTTIDVSEMEYLHLDVWTAAVVTDIETSLINGPSGTTEAPVLTALNADSWTSIDIPISDYTDQGLSVDEIFQLKFVGEPWAAGTVFIDNIYFYKGGSVFDDGLLTNGDFESGSYSWTIGVGTDPAPVVTVGDNTYYSVEVTTAGNPYDVNVSQKLEIIADETYTLTFDAWSDTNRAIVAGIGLSAGPWSNTVEEVNITTAQTTYTLTLTATAFGAVDARVLFDLGAEIGSVNIDNVSLFLN